jgi:hypothetical protein
MQVVAGDGEAMRDVDETVRRLRRQGYTVTRSKGTSHWKVTKGGRLLASISGTTGGRNSLRNLKGQLRRAEAGR